MTDVPELGPSSSIEGASPNASVTPLQPVTPQPQPASPATPAGPSTPQIQTVPASPVAPCCWCKKFEEDIAVAGRIYVLSTQHPNHQVQYRLTVDFVANSIVISRILKWRTVEPTVTQAERSAVQAGLTGAVPTLLSNKFSLKVTDATCSPTFKILPIRFEILWETTAGPSADLEVTLKSGPGRSSANGFHMTLHTTDVNHSHFVLAHEFLHTVGQVDEYSYGGTGPISATYNRADGTTQTITVPQTGNMMSTDRSLNMLPRFFWFVEIEAQRFLRSAAGLGKAAVTCEIV